MILVPRTAYCLLSLIIITFSFLIRLQKKSRDLGKEKRYGCGWQILSAINGGTKVERRTKKNYCGTLPRANKKILSGSRRLSHAHHNRSQLICQYNIKRNGKSHHLCWSYKLWYRTKPLRHNNIDCEQQNKNVRKRHMVPDESKWSHMVGREDIFAFRRKETLLIAGALSTSNGKLWKLVMVQRKMCLVLQIYQHLIQLGRRHWLARTEISRRFQTHVCTWRLISLPATRLQKDWPLCKEKKNKWYSNITWDPTSNQNLSFSYRFKSSDI